MKVSLVLTIHDRTEEVCRAVADSFKLPGNKPDEVVLVLDRASDAVRNGARRARLAVPGKGVELRIRCVHG